MNSADEYLRDVIAHINAFTASGSALAEPADDAAEWHPDGPAVDCLVCFGDDPECPWPHDADPFPSDGADTPPTLDQLEALYGQAPAAECLACFGGSPECPAPHGDPPPMLWKQIEISADGRTSEGDDE